MVAIRHPPAGRVPPFSCSPTLANEVNERLIHAKLSSRALEFCLLLHWHTLGNADGQRDLGHPEWRCPFDLVTWARALAWDKSNLRRLRQRLEACHIIHFEPDPDEPGQGWLGWNLEVEDWQLYDGRRTRQSRQRARQQPGVVNSTRQEPRAGLSQQVGGGVSAAQGHRQEAFQQASVFSITPQEEVSTSDQQAGEVISAQQDRGSVSPPEGCGAHAEAQASARCQQAGMVKLALVEGASVGAKELCQLVETPMEMTAPASSQVAPEEVSGASSQQTSVVILPLPEAAPTAAKELRQLVKPTMEMTTPASPHMPSHAASGGTSGKNLQKKVIAETPEGVSEMRSISPKACMTVALEQEEDEAGAASLLRAEPTSKSEALDSPPSPRAFAWPARAPHEKTDLDFYQRVVREREGQRVALLTRLAHERLSVPLASQSFARIGKLAKQCGAGLLVKHILLAAAQHLDGDPLDYLTKLVTNSKQKEITHDARPSLPTQRATVYPSNCHPYTAEEARQLAWCTL
jgi:hypothetical protein